MAKSVDQMIEELIGREGRYSFNVNDAGGETMFGITASTARANGYAGAMSQMTQATAAAIYRSEYFVKPGFDKVYALSQPIAEEMFDTGVNMGVSIPGPWLQRVLNAMNQGGKDFPDLKIDGDIGPTTIAALRAFLNKRGADGERVMVRALNCLQGARYLDITEKRAANKAFAFGWFLNRVEVA